MLRSAGGGTTDTNTTDTSTVLDFLEIECRNP